MGVTPTEGFMSYPFTSHCITSWQNDLTDILKVTISQRRATTVYSRENSTILNVFDLGTPQPTHYDPNDDFAFFQMAVTGDVTGLEYVNWIASQQDPNDPYDNQFILMDLIAVPVGIFNDPTFWGIYPAENLKIGRAHV